MVNNLIGAKRGGYFYTATLLLFLVFSFFARLLLGIFGAGKILSITVVSLVSVVAFAVSALVYAEKDAKKLKLEKFAPIYFVPTVLLTVGMVLGLGFLNTLISRGVESLGGRVAEIDVPLDSAFEFVLFSVVLCVLPAFFEELFFRGVILDALSDTHLVLRVVTVSLCFALYHGNFSQLAYQFVYGVGLCLLTIKAKSVVPAMIAHFFNNFFALATEYFNFGIDLFNPIIIACGAVLLLLFGLFTAFFRKEDIIVKGNESLKKFYFPFGVVGFIASVIVVVLSAIPG